MHAKILILVLPLALGLAGCAVRTAPTIRSTVETVTGSGTNQTRTLETKITKGSAGMAWGDARQAFDRERVSNGKTHAIGIEGMEQVTSATNVAGIFRAPGGLIGEAVSAYQKSQGIPPIGTAPAP